MLLAISSTGMSQAQIADSIGVTQPTVHRAMTAGSDVGYETGKKIEMLYCERVIPKAA